MNRSKSTQAERRQEDFFDLVAYKYDRNYGYGDKFTNYKIDKKVGFFLKAKENFLGRRKVRALELGCGTGEYTFRIASKCSCISIASIDISNEMLKIAKKKCENLGDKVRFFHKSAYSTGFKDNYFDLVYGFYFLHHVDIKKSLREVSRVLKPGGIAFFCEPNIINPYVFLVKNSSFLKRLVGDSPDEYAVNPLSLRKSSFFGLDVVDIFTSEFVLPVFFLPFKIMVFLDNLFSLFSFLPLFRWVGGSVVVVFRKRD